MKGSTESPWAPRPGQCSPERTGLHQLSALQILRAEKKTQNTKKTCIQTHKYRTSPGVHLYVGAGRGSSVCKVAGNCPRRPSLSVSRAFCCRVASVHHTPFRLSPRPHPARGELTSSPGPRQQEHLRCLSPEGTCMECALVPAPQKADRACTAPGWPLLRERG